MYGTETRVDVYHRLLGILGAGGLPARRHAPGAVLAGEVERWAARAQINTFGGGVNEVQREIVAASAWAWLRHDARQGGRR